MSMNAVTSHQHGLYVCYAQLENLQSRPNLLGRLRASLHFRPISIILAVLFLWPPSPTLSFGRKVTILFPGKSNIDKGERGYL